MAREATIGENQPMTKKPARKGQKGNPGVAKVD